MNPAALAKAESLYQYAQAQGAPLDTFLLVLSQEEAVELLEWYAGEYAGSSEAFDLDVSIARKAKDPWPVLANFHLLGLEMAPAHLVLN
jgi:hypothetical protein